MDSAIGLLYREQIPLDELAPRTIRTRIGSFAPLLAGATENTILAANELASAFLRHGGAESFELRIYAADDRVRVELLDSMLSEANLTAPHDQEGQLRLHLLDAITDRWGVLGNGISVVWFEVRRGELAAGEDLKREM
jgi:hypothetical protein